MTAVAATAPAEGAWHTLVRGLRLTPEARDGLTATLLLALVATAGSSRLSTGGCARLAVPTSASLPR
jgi:hypothetical protein